MEPHISISRDFNEHCPGFIGAVVYAKVKNNKFNNLLWDEINDLTKELRNNYTTETVKNFTPIEATRKAYKACGKEPSRYRPSNEALRRRILRGLDLYQINTLVDLINLASLKSGYSIGGFDADKIEGDEIILGIGQKDEPYEGIGRGLLNIENMPVFRDNTGGIGTPTSDNERTKISIETVNLMCIINGYDKNTDRLKETSAYMKNLLIKYAGGENIKVDFIAFSHMIE